MDQSFDSSSSTLSSSSTVTHCANLGTSGSNSDSNISNFFDSHTPCIMTLNESELFKQLIFARSGQLLYDQYSSWSDVSLWHEISRKIFESNPYVYKPSLSDLLSIVLRYHTIYTADPSLSRM